MSAIKRLLPAALLALLLTAVCSGQACALSYGAGTVTGDGLRLREEPNTSAPVMTTLSTSACVVVLEDARDGWYKASYQGETGYLSADYVEVSTKLDGDLGSGRVTTEGGSLNVRSGPGTENGKVTPLRNGAVVKMIIEPCAPVQSSGGYRPTADTTGTIGNGLSTEAGLEIVTYAETFLGTPYVYGGNGPNSFDCSGFVKYVFTHFGYHINRTASTQLNNGTAVSKDQLQPGDVVFFKNAGDSHAASHVGIYVGGETFIHASSDTREVEYSSLVTSNNAKKYIAARRIVGGE